MEIVEGFKRFSKIFIDKNSYGYRVNKKNSNGTLLLRCYEDSCHASGVYYSEENKFKAKAVNHNHQADTLLILKWRFLQRIKDRAETETTVLATIYQEECDNFPEVDHPPYSRLQSTLLKRRQAKKISDQALLEDSKECLNLIPYVKTPSFDEEEEEPKERLDEEYQDGGDIQLDEALKVIPQIFTEYASEVSNVGKIVDIVEGPKRFSRVYVDDVGYSYQMNKKRRDETLLIRCHLNGCSGTGIFDPDTMSFHRLGTHFHNPNPHAVLKLRFLQAVKFRAENETTFLSTIYKEEASRFQGTPLPSYDKIKSTLRKRRIASRNQSADQSSSFSRECHLKEKLAVATHFIGRKGMEVIEGPKRFSKIYIDDHSYCYLVNRRKSDGSLILRCHEDGCRGSGRFNPNESLFHKMAKHSHYADPLLVTEWRFLHQCKKRSENETTPIKTIYEQECQRHPNCNLPTFKKIESTLQKRRKSKRLKEDINNSQREPLEGDPESPETYELEVQMEEVYHPEGNPRYFISPNISYDVPVSVQENSEFPTSIVVRTGKSKNFRLEDQFEMDNDEQNESCNKTSSRQTKSGRKKGRKRKVETMKMKLEPKMKRSKSREPRRPSEYTSKMDVMEGTKRFSKIFIDESHHIYQLNKSRTDGALILKCYETDCHGSGLYFPMEEIFQRNSEHNHDPSTNLVTKCRLLSSLKFRAESESGSLRQIYEEEIIKYPGVEIPSFRQMESTLQKRRRAKVPSEPTSLSEAALQFQRTDFLKCDRGNFFRSYLNHNEHEMLVFISPGLLEEKFKQSKTFHIDSGLRVVPQGFSQVVIIYIIVADHVFPVVYALMNTKSSVGFVKFFEFLKEEYKEFDPQFVSTDYENELETAFQSVFPSAIVTGCWFHYTQAIWRQMRTCGLAQVYFQDEEAKMILKCAMALPLLPSVRIEDGIKFVQEAIGRATFHLTETKNSLSKMIDFIRDDWLQRIGPNRFSVFGLERKLNYDIEALYRYFIKKLGIESPPLIKFVEKIFQSDSIIIGEYNQKVAGKPIRADRSRKCNESEKMLKEICSRFEASQMSVDAFLTSASNAVPRHCHHDYLIYNPDEGTSMQDPSDIPVSLPFCEINVVAPRTSDSHVEREFKPFVTNTLNSLQSPNGNILIENLGVTSSPFQVDSVGKPPSQCHNTGTEGKMYSNVDLVWNSSFQTHAQTHQFDNSQQPSIEFTQPNRQIMKVEPAAFLDSSNSLANQSIQELESRDCISHSANDISHNEDLETRMTESCYNSQGNESLCQVSLISDSKSNVPVYLFYPTNEKS